MRPIALPALLAAILLPGALADVAAKPLVELTVKRHLTGTERDRLGARSDARARIVTLRVTVTNTSSSTIEGAMLAGVAMVQRSQGLREEMISESLKAVPLPPIKPNGRETIDLGEITLAEVEVHGREYEETLEQWKVVCMKGDTVIGSHSTGDFTAEAAEPSKPLRQHDGVNRRIERARRQLK